MWDSRTSISNELPSDADAAVGGGVSPFSVQCDE